MIVTRLFVPDCPPALRQSQSPHGMRGRRPGANLEAAFGAATGHKPRSPYCARWRGFPPPAGRMEGVRQGADRLQLSPAARPGRAVNRKEGASCAANAPHGQAPSSSACMNWCSSFSLFLGSFIHPDCRASKGLRQMSEQEPAMITARSHQSRTQRQTCAL